MTEQPSTEGIEVGTATFPADYDAAPDYVATPVPEEEQKPLMDLCFIDTETITLRAGEDVIWEFAGIRVDQRTGEEKSRIWFQRHANLGEADPFSLKIGKYYDRFGKNGEWEPYEIHTDEGVVENKSVPKNGEVVTSDFDAAQLINDFCADATVLGLVVSFDTERMERFLRDNLQCPRWHYHIIDVEPLCVGYLKAMGHHHLTLPYSSDEITKLMGVEPPSDEERHTALGDAEWVRRLWTAVNA